MNDIPQRTAALIAGFSIVTMAIAAGFACSCVLNNFTVLDDIKLTINNMKSSQTLFRLGIFSFLVILICDLLAAWSLHVFLKRVNENLSLLTAWFRLVYSAMLGTALLNLVFIVLLFKNEDFLSIFGRDQVSALAILFLHGFHLIWSIGLVIFGCHLLLLGYLLSKANYTPKIFSVLLIIASLCYIIHHTANLLLLNYEKYKTTVEIFLSLPMIVGELGFGLWLLVRGGKKCEDKKLN
ncbi:unnamed protein product [Adineta ricciae]|uniref:DUF4386 domain-containing protein n=1 Tax=Adineta ricciae TaxID=249248 RepID=A0A816BNP4_ADIRI|nr:unnamed protein product [Adineta ricciae]CAF1611467.1 unnamed protein product [Adineta ricciae]